MGIAPAEPLRPMVDVAHDYRPSSRWRQVEDPDGRTSMRVIIEIVAPGDAIPLHHHDADEVLIIEDGRGIVELDGDRRIVGRGDVVFVPAGIVHGLANNGRDGLAVRAIYSARSVGITFADTVPW